MPWSPKQMKAIRARAHGWKPSKGGPFENVSEGKAKEMEKEGVKAERAEHTPMKKGKRGKRPSLAAQLGALKGK